MKAIRIIGNAIIVIAILLSKIIIRSRKRIVYFNANTGLAEYVKTYYLLLFIPVWKKRYRVPKFRDYAIRK